MLTVAGMFMLLAQADAAPATPAPSPEATAEYQQRFLAVEDLLRVSDGESSQEVVFTQGKYRKPLSTPEFLEAVGRAEEAQQYRTRKTLAGVLVVGSVAVFVAGVISAATAASASSQGGSCGSTTDPGFSKCVQDMVRRGPSVGGDTPFLGSALLAAGLFGGALAIYPAAPDPVEMRRLADQHNQALRRRLTGVGLRLEGRF
jgi:hypothetical protein